jgi:phosphonoacetaldehyde hydrolase
MCGLSAEELAALSDAERAPIRARATADLKDAGAEFVIDSIADLPGTVDEIAGRLASGQRPFA